MNDSAIPNNPVGTLSVVGTPIGNLEEMTFRAVRILQTVHAIIAQNDRYGEKQLPTQPLLQKQCLFLTSH